MLGSVLGGCAAAPSNEQRAATLGRNGLTAADLPDTDRKVGTVFTGHGLHLDRQVRDLRGKHGNVRLEYVAFGTSDGAGCRRGCVTAIDRRGYYLTAAHAVGGDPLWVLCGDDVRPARVVFRGDADFDVAVLSVDRPIPDAFDWAAVGDWPKGRPVLEAGPTDPSGGLAMRDFAGRVRDVETLDGRDGPYVCVTSSLPARHGDSGGPVMTAAGRLVGVFVKFNPFWTQSFAVRPDPEWVRNVVEQDYRAYREAYRPTSPTSAPDPVAPN